MSKRGEKLWTRAILVFALLLAFVPQLSANTSTGSVGTASVSLIDWVTSAMYELLSLCAESGSNLGSAESGSNLNAESGSNLDTQSR